MGTRPGRHGRTLVSTGTADLDAALGGGLPLGCLVVVVEEEWAAPAPEPRLAQVCSELCGCALMILLETFAWLISEHGWQT